MNVARATLLAERLNSLSRNGKIEWRDTSDQNIIRVRLEAGSIVLEKKDFDSFKLSILNDKNTEVDYAIFSSDEHKKTYGELESTWELAWREILKSDELIEDLFTQLEELSRK